MKQANYDLFFSYIEDLLADDTVRAMRDIRQHADSVTRLSHSLFVAYLSYRICRFFDLRSVEAARGALLHDLFNYDQHEPENHKGHLRRHPFVALNNASARFALSPVERDAIAHHMWPLNISARPNSKEAAIVCISDKLCSIAEVSRLYLLLRMNRKLAPGF
ncbi:MAG: HD domain-containing protein [Clostridia bacterium]|nr:HD domain-containing protein [Clostridia bacterium]